MKSTHSRLGICEKHHKTDSISAALRSADLLRLRFTVTMAERPAKRNKTNRQSTLSLAFFKTPKRPKRAAIASEVSHPGASGAAVNVDGAHPSAVPRRDTPALSAPVEVS